VEQNYGVKYSTVPCSLFPVPFIFPHSLLQMFVWFVKFVVNCFYYRGDQK
jgi:hypothetical protein